MATRKILTSHSKPLLKTILEPRLSQAFKYLSTSESELPNKKVNTKVNFSPPDSDSDSDSDNKKTADQKNPNLPPPYDPFSKKPAVEDPKDPKDLQGIFNKMRTEGGLFDSAVKMFDGLTRDGLTDEALQLLSRIKDRGESQVVAHTAVMEAYLGAGRAKEAVRAFRQMLASGVAPNAYTYSVLVKGLAAMPGFSGEAGKYAEEMAGKGMRPGAGVWVASVEGLARDGKEEEAKKLVERLRGFGFSPDENEAREVLKGKRGPLFRAVMRILFDT